jgi:hypothetical protein
MGSSFFTWFLILLIILLSTFNTLFSGSKVIQVTNGSSILDAEAPSGQRNRKWFLIIITCTNLLRFCTIWITVYYLLKKSWTAADDIHTIYHVNISTWECWLIPSLPNYLIYIYFVHYLSRLYYKLQDANWKIFAYSWNIVNTIFWILCTVLFAQQILIAESHKALLIEEGPPPNAMIGGGMNSTESIVAEAAMTHHGVERAFAHLCLVYGIYNLLIISTILYFLYLIIQVFTNCTFANPARVLLRLSVVMGGIAILLFLQCIFYGEIYFTLDNIYGLVYFICSYICFLFLTFLLIYFRTHYDANSFEILFSIFLEVLCSLIILLTITNTCAWVEEKLRVLLQVPWIAQWMRRRSPAAAGKESTAGNSATASTTTVTTDYSSIALEGASSAMAVSLTTPTPINTTSGMMPSILHRAGNGLEEGRPLLSSYLNPNASNTGNSHYGSNGNTNSSKKSATATASSSSKPILPTLNASVLLHPSHASSNKSGTTSATTPPKPSTTSTTSNGSSKPDVSNGANGSSNRGTSSARKAPSYSRYHATNNTGNGISNSNTENNHPSSSEQSAAS